MVKEYLTAEARARVEIDRQLVACGWVVQERKDLPGSCDQGRDAGDRSRLAVMCLHL